VATDTSSELSTDPATGASVKRQYAIINGIAASLSGRQIQNLSLKTRIAAITPDGRVGQTSLVPPVFSNSQLWPTAAGVTGFWTSTLTQPTIAIVDSGVDTTRAADFGARVLAQQSFIPTGHGNGVGDSFGHGTFVAS